MDFYRLSPEQREALRQRFVIEIRRIFLKSGMSMNAIAGEARSELLYALRGERRPSEENLIHWCEHWHKAGIITGTEATNLMYLAGYPLPEQRLQALSATTEHRAICRSPKDSEHVTTDELQPFDANKQKIRKNSLQS